MRKPWSVRMFGWLFVACLAVSFLQWLGELLKIPVLALPIGVWVALGGAIFCGLLWCHGTLVARAVHHRAQLEAHALGRQFTLPVPGRRAPAVGPCQVCGASWAVWHCCRHGRSLCTACVARHETAECHYVPTGRFVKGTPPRPKAKKMATSPLELSKLW